MAKYEITHECGHTETVVLFGKNSDRERRIAWLESNPCRDCLRKMEQDRATTQQEEFGLPDLTGSEKQIVWAITIRARKVTEFSETMEKVYNHRDTILANREKYPNYTDAVIQESIEKIQRANTAMEWLYATKTDSKFWIENRDMTTQELLNYAMKESVTDEIESDIEEEKKTIPEIVIVPENPTEQGIALVTVCEGNVSVEYPKNDKFRELVKSAGFSWCGEDKTWFKNMSETTGSGIDRAADITNRLLRSGFTVKVETEEIKDKAVSGQFEQECKRWIVKLEADGDQVCIEIPFGNDDLYTAAKRIQGARWQTKRGMMVPVTSFDELKDFADCTGYKFTGAAMKAINCAEEEHEKLIAQRTTVVTPEKTISKTTLKDKLEPADVIDDLRDEN